MSDSAHWDDDPNYVSLAEEVKALQVGCVLCNPAWLKAIVDSGRFAPPIFFCDECCKRPDVALALEEIERKSRKLGELLRAHIERTHMEIFAKVYGKQPTPQLYGEQLDD